MILLFLSKIIVRIVKLKKQITQYAFLTRVKPLLAQVGTDCVLEYPFSILGESYISIGSHFVARKRLKLRAFDSFNNQKFTPEIKIGDYVSIETDCHIACINKVEIGNNVLIASKVFISDHIHGLSDYSDIHQPPLLRDLTSKGEVNIGNNVWIGEGVTILSGVTIGDNSIIGANSVVNKSIPSNCVAVGIPAKIVKQIT